MPAEYAAADAGLRFAMALPSTESGSLEDRTLLFCTINPLRA
jgi:hypothetical protein